MTLSRLSLAILSVLAGAPAFADDSGVDLDQGWNQTQKTAWLEAGQGSRMLPLAWLVALEQRASEEPLMSDALIRQYGYVPHTLGGSSVKVVQGYAVDRSDDSDLTFTKLRWKACRLQGTLGRTDLQHVPHLAHQLPGTQLTVYGGQTMGDLAGFQLEILGALQSTRADTAKFERFARKVLGADGLVSGYNDANKARLQAAWTPPSCACATARTSTCRTIPSSARAAWTPSVRSSTRWATNCTPTSRSTAPRTPP